MSKKAKDKKGKNDKGSKARDNGARAFRARVYVSLKPTVNDPEGITIGSALGSLGFDAVDGVRSGRYFEIALRAPSDKDAGAQVDQMCSRLLANPVIETYRFDIDAV